MILTRALAAFLPTVLGFPVLGFAVLVSTASVSFAEVVGVRFGGPPLTLVMTVDLDEYAFPPQGRAELAVADGRDGQVFRGPVPYRASKSQLRVEHPFPPAKVPLIRDRMRVTLVVSDRRGTPRTFRTAATNPKLPVTLVASGPGKSMLLAEQDSSTSVDPTARGPKDTSPATIVSEKKDGSATKSDRPAPSADERMDTQPGTKPAAKSTLERRDTQATTGDPKAPAAPAGGGTARGGVLGVRVTGPGSVTNSAVGINCREGAKKGCEAAVKEESVTLALTPDAGHRVASGCPAGDPKCSSVTRKLVGRTELKVVFEPDAMRLTVNVTGGGAVRVEGIDLPCREKGCSYGLRGDRVTLIAEPGSRLQLSTWGGACRHVKRELRCVVDLTGADTVDAVFVGNLVRGTVIPSPGIVVTVKPASNQPEGECRGVCEFFHPAGTDIVLEARLDAKPDEGRGSEPFEWWGCDVDLGPLCRLNLTREREITVGPPTWWGHVRTLLRSLPHWLIGLLGAAIVLCVSGYVVWRKLAAGKHARLVHLVQRAVRQSLLEKDALDAVERGLEQRRLEQAWRDASLRAAQSPGAQGLGTEPGGGGQAILADGTRTLDEMVSELVGKRFNDLLSGLPAVPQSRSGTEAARAVTSLPLADDEAKVAAAMNVSWQETLAGGPADRPALRARLQHLGLQGGEFYTPKDFVEHLDTVTQLPYTFTPAPTNGSWLLVPTSPPGHWLALPLTHTAVIDTAMAVVKRLFDGWDKLPARYRFELAYRPCRLRQVPGTEAAFYVERKGYFTLEGAPASAPSPFAPPTYDALVGTFARPSTGIAHAEDPKATGGSTDRQVTQWLMWLRSQVDDVRAESKNRARVDVDAAELGRRLASYDQRMEALAAAVAAVSRRPQPVPPAEPAETKVDQLLKEVETRLDARLRRAEAALKEELERQEEEIAELRRMLDRPVGSPEGPTARAKVEEVIPQASPTSPAPSSLPASFVTKWLPRLRSLVEKDEEMAPSDETSYLARLRRCRDELQLVAEEGTELQIGIVHLDVTNEERLRLVDVMAGGGSSLRCGHCTSLPGAMTYQHFVAVRTTDEAAVLLPPNTVAARDRWALGFKLLLHEEVTTPFLHVVDVVRPAVLHRHNGGSFGISDQMQLRLKSSST